MGGGAGRRQGPDLIWTLGCHPRGQSRSCRAGHHPRSLRWAREHVLQGRHHSLQLQSTFATQVAASPEPLLKDDKQTGWKPCSGLTAGGSAVITGNGALAAGRF